MRRKLSDEERKENRRKSYLKYRLTEKGRKAINRASLAYYHRNKAFRKNKVNKIENKKKILRIKISWLFEIINEGFFRFSYCVLLLKL